MEDFERRYFDEAAVGTCHVEEREDGGPVLRGFSAVFNKLTPKPIMGLFFEKFAEGAFAQVISRGDDVLGLFNHDPNIVLGRRSAGTLPVLEERKVGLYAEILPPATRADVVESVRRRDVKGQSIAFRVKVDEFKSMGEGKPDIRTVKEVAALRDLGPVTFPAFPQTTATLRSVLMAVSEDSEALAAALARRSLGEELRDVDRAAILSTTQVLLRMLPATEELEQMRVRGVTHLRRRLDLAELERPIG